jgi:putative PIN family toxin of toxin-antitoxin system
MRVVADTNIVISGLFWRGAPRRVLELGREGRLELWTSVALLTELNKVLRRQKLARHLERAQTSSDELVVGYAALARQVVPTPIGRIVPEDPDDDEVVACALAANASVIVTGDRHLLDLGTHQEIEIVTVHNLIQALESEGSVSDRMQ